MQFTEQQIKISLIGNNSLNWFLELNTSGEIKLPFIDITQKQISAKFEGMNYFVTAIAGSFSNAENGSAFRISPKMNLITLNLTDGDSFRIALSFLVSLFFS